MPVSQTSIRSLSPRRRQPSRILPCEVYFTAVPQEIADHLFEQARIAPDMEAASDHAPAEFPGRHVIAEFGSEAIEQRIDRKDHDLRIDDPGFELIDVEQRVQHARHDLKRLVELADQRQGGFVLDRLRQNTAQQADGLQRLAQIVTGGGEKTRFAEIGPLRLQTWRPPARVPRVCAR